MIGESRTLHLIGLARRKGVPILNDALRAEWLSVDRMKRAQEAPIVRIARGIFADQEREVLSRLEAVLGKSTLIASQLLDMATWLREIELRFGPAVVAVIRSGFDAGLSRVQVSGIDFTSSDPSVTFRTREILAKTKNIQATTTEELGDLIQKSLVRGDSMDDIRRAVREKFTEWQGWRAEMIAETAATSAFESGQQIAFEDADIDEKRWLSQRDGAVRATHLEADGQQVGIKDSFYVGNVPLDYPGDPSGPPQEVIRCRCTSNPVITSS